MIRGGGICKANAGGDLFQVSEGFRVWCRGGRLCPPDEQPRILAVLCRGRCPHRPAGKLRIRRRFPYKRCNLPGRCGHRPLQASGEVHTDSPWISEKSTASSGRTGSSAPTYFVTGERFSRRARRAGAGVHTIRQVRPTRPCAERSGGVFQGFICPAGRRCRAARDPRGIRAMRRRRWRCG